MLDDFRLPRACRLRCAADFRRAFDARCSAGDGFMSIFVCRNGAKFTRLGLSVPRRVGGAVMRNRWKRLLREAFRLRRHDLPDGLDLVIVPRAAEPPTLAAMLVSLPKLVAKLERRLNRKGTPS
jgi:ribonuclease P protein component